MVFTAPFGGKVASVNLGERRRILEVVIETNPQAGFVEFKSGDPLKLSSEEIKTELFKSGLWPFIKRRPYGIVALPDDQPKAIFISTYDTAPLAPDYNFILEGQMGTFQTGINALSKLTAGKIFLGLSEKSVFGNIKNVEYRIFAGPHPAGNVGVQIHHVSPLNKGEVVWTINPQDVLFIGRLFETGKTDFTKMFALTGSEVEKPKYFQTLLGTRFLR